MRVKVRDWLNLSKSDKLKMLAWLVKDIELQTELLAEQAEAEFEDYIDNRY